MKKQDRLLLMTAICGELPAKLAGQVVGSDSYAAALVTRLKQEGYISARTRDGQRGYVLRAKGRRYVLSHCGEDGSFFVSDSAATSHVKSEPDKRERLHRMGEVWVFLWKAGVCIFQSQKPEWRKVSEGSGVEMAAYYGSLEFKRDSEAIQGSRACGLLLSGDTAWVVYNTRAQRMKWAKKTERSMRVWTERLFLKSGNLSVADAVVFGEEPGLLAELLESDGGIRKNLFQVDDVYEHYYYVPMQAKAAVQVWLLADRSKRCRVRELLNGILVRKRENDYALCDGYDTAGNPVYFCHELEMRHLLRIKQETIWRQTGTIVCLDYQEEALKEYFGDRMRIQAVVTEKLEEYLQQG